MSEAMICGIDPMNIYDYTWGELIDYVNSANERMRRTAKQTAKVAFGMVGLMFSQKEQTIYDAFPFCFTEEEIREAEVEKYRQRMFRHAQASKQHFNKDSN